MSRRKWQLQSAKARLGEVIRRASKEGPQIVTFRGQEAGAIVSIDDLRLIESARPSLVEHLLSGPKLDDETVERINARGSDTGRDIDL